MTDLRRRISPLWRHSATPEELTELQRLDSMLELLNDQRRDLVNRRRRLANRLANRTLGRRATAAPPQP